MLASGASPSAALYVGMLTYRVCWRSGCNATIARRLFLYLPPDEFDCTAAVSTHFLILRVAAYRPAFDNERTVVAARLPQHQP